MHDDGYDWDDARELPPWNELTLFYKFWAVVHYIFLFIILVFLNPVCFPLWYLLWRLFEKG